MKADKLELAGIVTKCLKGGVFEVTLDLNKQIVTCKCSGKLMVNKIKILANDQVVVAISPYDLTKGIIVWRGNPKDYLKD